MGREGTEITLVSGGEEDEGSWFVALYPLDENDKI